jgi:NAD(P)-dependent dehydrogenase (short-subunit alcohol dehydrogenase family)
MAKVLITGATGGFGTLITKQLLNDGHKVAGTARDIQGRNRAAAKELESLGAKVIEMDITDDMSVTRAMETATKQLGGMDTLINNAGVGVIGLTEAFTPEDMKRLFDVNVFGVQRTCRAIAPMMRELGTGLIINISSLLGRMTVPFYGPYNASKWALEGLTENYRTELSQFGIDVCIVEPGGFPTAFVDNLMRPSDTTRSKTYGPMGDMPEGFLKGFEQTLAANPKQNPDLVAKAVSQVIAKPQGARPFRTIVDTMGMGAALSEYNEALARITEGVYSNFGIAHLLKTQVRPRN